MKNDRLRIDIISWNNRFPLDKWWRKKYNIPYLSEEHRESTFFNQLFEYHEDKLFEEQLKEVENENSKFLEEQEYVPMSGNWWKGKKDAKEDVDNWLKTPL